MYCHESCLFSQLFFLSFFFPKSSADVLSDLFHNGESDFGDTILSGVASCYFCPWLWPAKITIFRCVSLLFIASLPWKKALSLRFLENNSQSAWGQGHLYLGTNYWHQCWSNLHVGSQKMYDSRTSALAVHKNINFLNYCFCRFLSSTLTAAGSLC